MKKSITSAGIVILLALILLMTGCIGLRVHEGVADAGRYFDRAQAEIAGIQAADPDRTGRVRELCVLIHDQRSHELIEISTPIWVANACLELASDEAGGDWDRNLKDRIGFRLDEVKDLDRLGPGLLVELNDSDTRLLVWLR